MSYYNYSTPIGYDHPVTRELTNRYGMLISHADLAALLQRSPHALRQAMLQCSEPWSTLRAGRRSVGRRIHYDVRTVAAVVAGETDR